MDYYVLDKEGESSKCGMLDLGKCIDGSSDSAEENVFSTTSAENNREREAKEEEQSASSTTDYEGERTEAAGNDHIMQFISTTPEVRTTGFTENSEPQMEKSMNVCDSATDSMLKEIIDMNVVGTTQSEGMKQPNREDKEKEILPGIDQSSTDEDSSKSLVSNETSSDSKKAKTLDDILDDFCDENSDTVTSQTSNTTDTDDNGLLESKNPLFEDDKVEVEEDKVEKDLHRVEMRDDKIEDKLQSFGESEQEENLQRLDDKKISEVREDDDKIIRETEVNETDDKIIRETEVNETDDKIMRETEVSETEVHSRDIQDMVTQERVSEKEVMNDDMDVEGRNELVFSADDQVTETCTFINIPPKSVNHKENDCVTEQITPENTNMEVEDRDTQGEESRGECKGDDSEKEEYKDVANILGLDDKDGKEEMKNHNTHVAFKKKGLKLSRHNINTGTMGSLSSTGETTNENNNKRDLGDGVENIRKKLKTVMDTETSCDDRRTHTEEQFEVMEDTQEVLHEEVVEGGNQMTEMKESSEKSIGSPIIGSEVDPQVEPQVEKEVLNGLRNVEDAEDLSDTIEDAGDTIEDASDTIKDAPNKDAQISDLNQEKSTNSEDAGEEASSLKSSEITHEEEKRDEPIGDHIEDENSSTKETAERPSSPREEVTEGELQKESGETETLPVPVRDSVSSEEGSSSCVPEDSQGAVDDAYADFDEENIENISRTIRSFTTEKLSPKKQEKTAHTNKKEESPSKKVIMVKTAPNVEKVKRKLEEILEKSKGEEDAAIAELQRMKKEKTDILNAITTEMEKLKAMLVKGKQG